MTEEVMEETDTDLADRGTEHGRDDQSATSPDQRGSGPAPTYVVRLRHDLQITDVTCLLHYISDFGSGDARGYVIDGGWCLGLSSLADLRLLSSQCAELIEGHDIEYVEVSR